jgi:hypothetical protein
MESVHPPVLFHPLKHHLLWIRSFIELHALRGEAVMPEVAARLTTAGNSQMDVYTGTLPPAAVAGAIVQYLSEHNLLEPGAYADWLQTASGYRLVTLTDRSEWVLRWGEVPGSYAHIHPARYSPFSIRVKASTLKTAIMVCIWHRLNPNEQPHLTEINHLRRAWLQLPPIRSVEEAEGLRRFLTRLTFKET